MSFPGFFKVVVSFGLILKVNSNCNIPDKRTTCITEDLLKMLMKINSEKDANAVDHVRPAFFAGLKNDYAFIGLNDVLEFDDVKFNRGDGYNPSTGVFTAPRDGVYQFSCSILGRKPGQEVNYQLNKNDILYMKGHSPVVSNVASSTINAIVKMTKNDRLFIKHRSSSTEYVYGTLHSSFSGYFLYE